MRSAYNMFVKLNRRDSLTDLGIYERITLKCILNGMGAGVDWSHVEGLVNTIQVP
jgi:hypothetical protein